MTYASSGTPLLSLQLPPGLSADHYALSISVQVYDNSQAYVVYTIPRQVTVYPNLALAFAVADGILNNDASCQQCAQVNANTLGGTIQIAITVLFALDGSISVLTLKTNSKNVSISIFYLI